MGGEKSVARDEKDVSPIIEFIASYRMSFEKVQRREDYFPDSRIPAIGW
jgi:hypothetical protein